MIGIILRGRYIPAVVLNEVGVMLADVFTSDTEYNPHIDIRSGEGPGNNSSEDG